MWKTSTKLGIAVAQKDGKVTKPDFLCTLYFVVMMVKMKNKIILMTVTVMMMMMIRTTRTPSPFR